MLVYRCSCAISRPSSLKQLGAEQREIPRVWLGAVIHLKAMNAAFGQSTAGTEFLERRLGQVDMVLSAPGAFVNDPNLNTVVVGVLVAQLYELATLRTVRPAFDDSADVRAILGLPAATAVTALRVFQIMRRIPRDLHVFAPQRIAVERAHAEHLARVGGRLVLVRVLVVMLRSSHVGTLLELLRSVVVIIFVAKNTVDVLHRVSCVVKILRHRLIQRLNLDRFGYVSFGGSSTNGGKCYAGHHGAEKRDSNHSCRIKS